MSEENAPGKFHVDLSELKLNAQAHAKIEIAIRTAVLNELAHLPELGPIGVVFRPRPLPGIWAHLTEGELGGAMETKR